MGAKSDLQIAQPLTLNCGLTLPNRLVKAAMAEQLAGAKQLPDERMQAVYKHWSAGGWGLIITGHVHVDDAYLGMPSDPAIPPSLSLDSLVPPYSALARASQGGAAPPERRTPTIVQLNHPGRQSPRGCGTRPLWAPALAPSAVPVWLGPGLLPRLVRALTFGTPRAMSRAEIAAVASQFARAARVCAEAGFDGVEIHAAHGYLLSQFLGRATNRRGDEYGGDARARARAVVDVVRAVRDAVRPFDRFCVGIKLNSVDHQGDQGELDDCVEQVRALVEAGVDFIEVSGGSFEDPKMIWGNDGPDAQEEKSDRTKAREAFFLEFAKVIRKEFPGVPLMVTGGFSSRVGMEKAVAEGDCDLIGLARPAVLNPSLPNNIVFNPEVNDQDATLYRKKNKTPWFFNFIGMPAVGAGMDSQWYSTRIQELAKT
ncbi:FMN binding oxidoreductase [Thermothelomyces heterothallicus CBS 202.75]|uniref:FMN binding oxidoreductase n=1 Tax=Thermothelomyces heterothallicus CBS 202.75 TaxID=1149848 RepID=UPI0037422A3C